MPDPRTEAGRALLARLGSGWLGNFATLRRAVLAVEAQAATEARRELREDIEGLRYDAVPWSQPHDVFDAVLHLIEEQR